MNKLAMVFTSICKKSSQSTFSFGCFDACISQQEEATIDVATGKNLLDKLEALLLERPALVPPALSYLPLPLSAVPPSLLGMRPIP